MSDFKEFVTCAGDRVRPVYAAKVDKSGKIDLEQVGEESLYDFIQSFRDSCDVNKIVQRYQNGEVDVLQRVQGVFGDFTHLPKTYAELMQLQLDAKRIFDDLPAEKRNAFSFDEFMSTAGSKEWFDKLGVKFVEKEKESEVKNES